MTALIIWTTISMIDTESIGNLSTKRIGYIQRCLTLLFAILQSCALVLKFRSSMIDQKSYWRFYCPVVFRSSSCIVCRGIVRCMAS